MKWYDDIYEPDDYEEPEDNIDDQDDFNGRDDIDCVPPEEIYDPEEDDQDDYMNVGCFHPLRDELPEYDLEDSIFKEGLTELDDKNKKSQERIRKKYGCGKIDEFEAISMWNRESIDMDEIIDETSKVEQWLNKEAEKFLTDRDNDELSEFGLEMKADKLRKVKFNFERKLRFKSVGLSMEDIIDVADDAGHLIEDTYDPESRQVRKAVKKVPRSDRKEMIDNLFENGDIDEKQYVYLCQEFL